MEKIIVNTREDVEAAMQMLQSNNYIEEAQQLFDWWKTGHTNGQDWKTFDSQDALLEDIKKQQVKKADRKAKNTGTKKKSKKSEIVKLPKDMAEKSGWLAIQDGVSLSGIDHQIFMAKVMQMFDDEMQSAEYRERMNKEMAKVNELQSKVNSLTAKIQPTLDEIAQLKNEIASIEKQWDKRTNFRSVVGQYTNILYSNSEKGSHV